MKFKMVIIILNEKKLVELINSFEEHYTSIYPIDFWKKKLEEIGFKLDEENNVLDYNGNIWVIPVNYGFNDEKGYASGFVLQVINYLLNKIEVPEMTCIFPSSIYYAFEVDKNTRKAVNMILAICDK